jgi:hypothetical protein
MEPNVMCETIATTLFDDKDLILTVFRHVPTKYVFAVVTSYKELWNVRISTSPTLEDWVDDTLYLGKARNSLHKDRQKWVQASYRYARSLELISTTMTTDLQCLNS